MSHHGAVSGLAGVLAAAGRFREQGHVIVNQPKPAPALAHRLGKNGDRVFRPHIRKTMPPRSRPASQRSTVALAKTGRVLPGLVLSATAVVGGALPTPGPGSFNELPRTGHPFETTVGSARPSKWRSTLKDTLLATPQDSGNSFAGYDRWGPTLTEGAVTEVDALWNVPTLNCTATPNAQIAVWVGIDAMNSSNSNFLAQPGILGGCYDGQPGWNAVYQMAPAPINLGPSNISAGDVMYALVSAPGGPYNQFPGAWDLQVDDLTKGWSWAVPVTTSFVSEQIGVPQDPLLEDAAWVVEAPGTEQGTQPDQLAAFSPIIFLAADAVVNGVYESGGSMPSGLPPLSITQHDPTEWADPSPWMDDNDSSFTVTYGQPFTPVPPVKVCIPCQRPPSSAPFFG